MKKIILTLSVLLMPLQSLSVGPEDIFGKIENFLKTTIMSSKEIFHEYVKPLIGAILVCFSLNKICN